MNPYCRAVTATGFMCGDSLPCPHHPGGPILPPAPAQAAPLPEFPRRRTSSAEWEAIEQTQVPTVRPPSRREQP